MSFDSSAGSSGLSHLPSEIVTEIFFNVCDRIPLSKPLIWQSNGSTKKKQLIYPFFLGKVCRGWREIAWTCPLLWNVIHIPLSLRKYEQQLVLLQEWLDRTADCPLSICLEVHDGEGLWRGTDFLRGLFNLLVAESSRWERIEFFLPKHSKGVLNAACLRVPLLRSATVRALSSVDVQLEFLKSAPKLENLDLKRISPKGVDCENLTHLAASFVSITDIIAMLQNAPSLENCDLQNTYGAPTSMEILHFPLPSLRSLRLRDSHSATLLPHFGIVPMLQDLEISDCNDYLSLEVLSSFLERAQCTLRSLTIGTGETLDPNDFCILLKGINSVSSLEIQHYYAGQGELEVFSVFLDVFDPVDTHILVHNEEDESEEEPDPSYTNKDNPVFLPNLRKLGYQLPLKFAEGQLERLYSICQKRWNDGKTDFCVNRETNRHSAGGFARLESLQFDPFFSSAERIKSLLRKEMEEGLKITFDLPLVDSEDEDP